MLDFLNLQLGNQYKLIQETDNELKSIKVHNFVSNTDVINQDTYIKLDNEHNVWKLYEGHRNKEFLLGEFYEERVSFTALYIAVISILGPMVSQHEVRKELRHLNDDADKAQDVLNNYIENLYSFFDEKKEVINLEKINSSSFNVYYLSFQNEKVLIVSDVEASTAFSVVYNFGVKLKEFDKIIHEWEKNINIKLDLINREKLKRLFLGK